MKKSEILFGIMLGVTVLYVLSYTIFTTIFGPFETSQAVLTSNTFIGLFQLALTGVFPLLVIFVLRVESSLKRFSYGMIAFVVLKMIFNTIRYAYLTGSDNSTFGGLAMPTLLFVMIMIGFVAIIAYMIYTLIQYVKFEKDGLVKAALIIVVVEYFYNLPVFNLLRTRFFESIDLQYLMNYARVIVYVPIIVNLVLALTIYILALREDRELN